MKKGLPIVLSFWLAFFAIALLVGSCDDRRSLQTGGSIYSVEYKQPGDFFWKELPGIKGDGIMFAESGQVVPMRYFILVDETRVEIPMTMMFRFDPGRFRAIENSVRKESGR